MNNKLRNAIALSLMVLAAPVACAAAKATVNLSGKVTGARDGNLNISVPAFTASNAIGQRQTLALTTSLATFSIPTGTTAVLMVMPAAGATVSIAGTTGASAAEQIHFGATAAWAFLPLASTATLAASASAATSVTVTFF